MKKTCLQKTLRISDEAHAIALEAGRQEKLSAGEWLSRLVLKQPVRAEPARTRASPPVVTSAVAPLKKKYLPLSYVSVGVRQTLDRHGCCFAQRMRPERYCPKCLRVHSQLGHLPPEYAEPLLRQLRGE
jgi:hypothetical protein